MKFGDVMGELSAYTQSRIVVLPVPFGKEGTWLKGSEKGPAAIIDASQHLELYDIETGSEVFKKGIFTAPPVKGKTSKAVIAALERRMGKYLDEGKFVCVLGGNHQISAGPVRACRKKYRDVSVLHLDAHTDRRDTFLGSKTNHGCVVSRIKESVKKVVSVGIRSMDSSELKSAKQDTVVYASEVMKSDAWHRKVLNNLSKNVYVTVDLDVFDPGIMPSVGTPEPGGLDWYQVTGLLRKVFARKNVVGCDVVELAPASNKAPDFLAAKLAYKMMSYKFRK